MYYNDSPFPFSCCVTQLFFLCFRPTRRRSVVSADLLLIAHSTFYLFHHNHHYCISSFSIILPTTQTHSCWAPIANSDDQWRRDGVTPTSPKGDKRQINLAFQIHCYHRGNILLLCSVCSPFGSCSVYSNAVLLRLVLVNDYPQFVFFLNCPVNVISST